MKTARETALEIVRGQMGEEVDESCDCGWVFDIERAITSAVREARREERERVLRLVAGCHDFNGGHCGPECDAFHHGIQTVANVMEAAFKPDADKDTQIIAVERIGARALAREGE